MGPDEVTWPTLWARNWFGKGAVLEPSVERQWIAQEGLPRDSH